MDINLDTVNKTKFFERESVKWVYFLPLAVLATILVNLIFGFLDFIFWSKTTYSGEWLSNVSKELIRGVMTSYVFYSIIYDFAPKYQLWISILLGVILALLIGMIIPSMGQGQNPEVLISFSIGMLGGAIWTIYHKERKTE